MSTNTPSQTLIDFILGQTAFTMAVSENDQPYVAHCFYTYIPEKNLLVFKSKEDTVHIIKALRNKKIAGTINPNKLEKTKIQGVQFTGTFISDDEETLSEVKKSYYKSFPFALAMPGTVWAIQLEYVKFTNNVLGVMKKEECFL